MKKILVLLVVLVYLFGCSSQSFYVEYSVEGSGEADVCFLDSYDRIVTENVNLPWSHSDVFHSNDRLWLYVSNGEFSDLLINVSGSSGGYIITGSINELYTRLK